MKPLISVIIPAFNAEGYIKEAIESALNQTYENIEIIVVDDGSTDRTAEIVKSFEDPRIVYIYQKNQGQSAARNAGIKIAKGKYIAFLDSDDLFLPKKLEKQVSFLESHPDYGVCYCDIRHFYDKKSTDLLKFRCEHYSGYIFDKLLEKNFIDTFSVVLRKEILDKFGGFNDDFRRCDEQYLWLKLSYNKVKFFFLNEVLAYSRLHPMSLSRQRIYIKESAQAFLKILDWLESLMTEEERKKYSLNKLRKFWRRRLFIGDLIAQGGLLSSIFIKINELRLRLKFKKVKEHAR